MGAVKRDEEGQDERVDSGMAVEMRRVDRGGRSGSAGGDTAAAERANLAAAIRVVNGRTVLTIALV